MLCPTHEISDTLGSSRVDPANYLKKWIYRSASFGFLRPVAAEADQPSCHSRSITNSITCGNATHLNALVSGVPCNEPCKRFHQSLTNTQKSAILTHYSCSPMRTNIDIDDRLMRQAMRSSGA